MRVLGVATVLNVFEYPAPDSGEEIHHKGSGQQFPVPKLPHENKPGNGVSYVKKEMFGKAFIINHKSLFCYLCWDHTSALLPLRLTAIPKMLESQLGHHPRSAICCDKKGLAIHYDMCSISARLVVDLCNHCRQSEERSSVYRSKLQLSKTHAGIHREHLRRPHDYCNG